MTHQMLANLAQGESDGQRRGVTSVCSAHPFVIEAALRQAKEAADTVLIEATCNQVNHQGGYTGMTAGDFRDFVFGIADRVGLPKGCIVLGGDHLGPNPWKGQSADEAMGEAEHMVASYVEAGFRKIHLDTSMACRNDPVPLPEKTIAERAARLASVAERVAAARNVELYYVIGTEVPIPGGAHESIETLEVTDPGAALRTVASHRRAFRAAGVDAAFDRVIALVVQPGVEFGSENIIDYAPERAADLSRTLGQLPGLVFEAHSTDYQSRESLSALVRDGFAILKVGPGLTFAMREALYGLDAMRRFLRPEAPSLTAEMEAVMCDAPSQWQPYYAGSEDKQRLARHFSYSDRIRYYWPQARAQAAVERLFADLQDVYLPETLISQHLPRLYQRVRCGVVASAPRELVIESITSVLEDYARACRPAIGSGERTPTQTA